MSPFDYRAVIQAPQAPNYTSLPNTGAYTNVPDGAVFVTTGSSAIALMAGDGVVALESGQFAPIVPAIGGGHVNNTSGPVVAKSVYTPLGTYSVANAGTGKHETFAELNDTSKTVVVVYAGNNASASTGLNIAIVNPLTGTLGTPTVIDAGSMSEWEVFALASGRVAVAYNDSTTLKFVVYNADLTVFTAAVTVSTLGSSNFTACQIVSGNIVLCYDKVTTRNFVFSRYTEAGVLQGAETTIEAGATATTLVKIIANANGDFTVLHYRSAATQAYKLSRWTSAGAVATAITTVTTATVVFSSNANQVLLELPNGNIVMVGPVNGGADSNPDIFVRTSALASVTTIDLGTAGTNVNMAPAMCLTADGGFAVATFTNSGTSVFFGTWSSAGVNTNAFVALTGVTTPQVHADVQAHRLYNQGAAGFLFAMGDTNTAGIVFAMCALTITPTGALRGSVLAVDSGATSETQFAFFMTAAGFLLSAWTQTANTIRLTTYKTMMAQILGYAASAGSQYLPAQVNTKGSFQINQNCLVGANFDGRATTVPGARGTLVGKSLYLTGTI